MALNFEMTWEREIWLFPASVARGTRTTARESPLRVCASEGFLDNSAEHPCLVLGGWASDRAGRSSSGRPEVWLCGMPWAQHSPDWQPLTSSLRPSSCSPRQSLGLST